MAKRGIKPYSMLAELHNMIMCKAFLRSVKVSHFKTLLASLILLATLQVQAAPLSCEKIFEATPQEQLEAFSKRYSNVQVRRIKAPPPIANTYHLKDGLETSTYEADQLAFNPQGVSPAAKAHLVQGEVDSQFPYPEFLGDRLSFNNNNYRLINVGHHQQAHDWPQIQNAVARGQQEAAGQNIVVQMSATWSYGRKVIESWCESTSEEVIKTYKKRKSYLNTMALWDLSSSDIRDKQNDDYFVLLKDSNRSPLEYSKKDFEENLLMSIRLARMQANDSAFPYSLTGEFSANDHLPASHRDQYQIVANAKNILYKIQREQGLKVAEISRFVRFGDVPPEVMNSFLTKLFQTAIDPKDPIDLLIISVDPATRALFKSRYKFEDLVTIPNKNEIEYLMFLDTRSEIFSKTLAKLQASDSLVQKEQVTEKVASNRWSQPWGVDKIYTPTSGFSPYIQGETQIKRFRNQIVRLGSHLSTTNSFLRNSKATPNRVADIVNHVLYYDAAALDKFILGLSSAEKAKVFANADLFSSEWQSIVEGFQMRIRNQQKILIVGEKASTIKAILESQYIKQKIDAVNLNELSPPEKQYDLVLVVESLSSMSTSGRVNLLKGLEPLVSESGYLTLLEPYDWKNHILMNLNTKERITKYAQSMVANEAPMTEFELAVSLRQMYRSLRTAEQNQFGHKDMDAILENQVGLKNDTFGFPAKLLGLVFVDTTRNPYTPGP